MTRIDVLVLGDLDEDLANLSGEVLRVKASLLYGDHVTVESHKILFLLGRMTARARLLSQQAFESDFLDKDNAEKLAQLLEERGVVGDLNGDFFLEALRGEDPNSILLAPEALAEAIRKKKQGEQNEPSPADLFRAIASVSVTNYLRSHPRENQEQILESVDELVALSDSGFVQVDSSASEEITVAELDDVQQSFSESVLKAFEMLLRPEGSQHPLFTASTRLALKKIRDRGDMPGADFTRANRVQLAAKLVADIPSFPTATVDEVLDIRSRIEPHLKRFRSAIAELEETLETDVLADDFEFALSEIKSRQIDPAMEELHESLNEEGLLHTVARVTPLICTGVLGLGASLAVNAPDLAGAAAVAAGATTATAKEFLERHALDSNRKKSRLFLLFDVERQLARARAG